VHHVGILYDQFMMHGQRNIKLHHMFTVYAIHRPKFIIKIGEHFFLD